MDDFSIAPETLRHQAGIAESAGRRQLAENLLRAAELVHVPDAVILDFYNALRPGRSTASELGAMARRLRMEFSAPACARWVEEALEVYARRGLLRD
jgi:propanediol dehydratase small subunit